MRALELWWGNREQRLKFWPFLYFFSLVYRLGVWARNWCYRNNWFASESAKLPVVCVGSIFVGGSGKTPFVRHLLEAFSKKSFVLTRGYRSLDEALFYENCVVDADRVRGALICQTLGAELVLMDDGWQHLRLKKDLSIAVLSYEQLEKEWAFLPLGALRDCPSRLREAGYIVFHEIPSLEAYEKWKKLLLCEHQKAMGTEVVFKGFYRLDGTKVEKISKAVVVSGIARPERVLKLMEEQGVHVIHHEWLEDHAVLSEEEWHARLQRAKNLDAVLVCTEKDAVKYPATSEGVQIKIGLRVVYEPEHFSDLVEQMERMVQEKVDVS